MRISDWSSDVCSSDLRAGCSQRIDVRPQRPSLCRLDRARCQAQQRILQGAVLAHVYRPDGGLISLKMRTLRHAAPAASFGGQVDRQSVVEGKSVSVRVDLGGRLILKKKNTTI